MVFKHLQFSVSPVLLWNWASLDQQRPVMFPRHLGDLTLQSPEQYRQTFSGRITYPWVDHLIGTDL